MMKFKYPAVIRPLSKEEGGGYLIEFPDLPGFIADGSFAATLLAEGLEHHLHQKHLA